jgi:hypothetical protein
LCSSRAPVIHLEDQQAVTQRQELDLVLFLYLYDTSSPLSIDTEIVEQAKENILEVAFYASNNQDLYPEYQRPSLLVLKDNKVIRLSLPSETLSSFVSEEKYSIIGQVNAENAEFYLKGGHLLVLIVIESNLPLNSIKQDLLAIAEKKRADAIKFGTMDANTYAYYLSNVFGFQGLDDSGYKIYLIDTENEKYYEGDFKAKTLETHISEYKEGKLSVRTFIMIYSRENICAELSLEP